MQTLTPEASSKPSKKIINPSQDPLTAPSSILQVNVLHAVTFLKRGVTLSTLLAGASPNAYNKNGDFVLVQVAEGIEALDLTHKTKVLIPWSNITSVVKSLEDTK